MEIEINLKAVLICITAIAMIVFGASCFTMIEPGNVGVKVNLFGDKKGVDSHAMSVGAHFVPPWKQVYRFPVFEQNYCWEGNQSFQFQTRDGMVVYADIGITYRIRPEDVHNIFQRYRRGIDEITSIFLRNYMRDAINKAASRYKIDDLYSTEKERFFDEVQSHVSDTLHEIGIDVSRIYLIGRFHFPNQVVNALNAKIEAMQRAEQRENELREAEAEAKKQIAAARGQAEAELLISRTRAEAMLIDAKATADGNKLIAESLTSDVLESRRIDKWDGKLPEVLGSDLKGFLMQR